MTSADTCQCVRLGTLLLVSIVCANDELYNVSHKWHQNWANSSTEGNLSWTTLYAALVSEFPLVTQLDWALNYLSVWLPMLLPRLQRSRKNGASTFLRFPLHCEYQRMSTGYSTRCSCLTWNWVYLLTQREPLLQRIWTPPPPSQIWTPDQTFLLRIVCIIFGN